MVRELSSIASNTLNSENMELVNLALDSLQKLALKPCPETANMLEKTLIRSATQELSRLAFNQRQFRDEGGGSTEASLAHTEFIEARVKNIISAIPEQNLHFAIEAMAGYSVFRTSLHTEFSSLLTKALKNPASAVPALFSVIKELNHLLSKATGEHSWGLAEKLTSDEKASLEMIAGAITAANVPENQHAQYLLTQINSALEQAKPTEAVSESSVLTKLATGLGTTVEALLENLKTMVANNKILTEAANPSLN